MSDYSVNYNNATFHREKIEVDGKSFRNCMFEHCIVIVEKGNTDLTGCRFNDCKLMLRGNAYTVGRLIKLFTGSSPLKVLDFDEPLFEAQNDEVAESKGRKG
jgi:hypothetical protein